MSEELVCLEELGIKGEAAKILKEKGIVDLGRLRTQSKQSLSEIGLLPNHVTQVSNALGQLGYYLPGH